MKIRYMRKEVEIIVQRCRNEFNEIIEDVITTDGDNFDEIIHKLNEVSEKILTEVKLGHSIGPWPSIWKK